MVIFHSYVSLPEGMASNVPMFTWSNWSNLRSHTRIASSTHLGGGAFRGELRADGLQSGLEGRVAKAWGRVSMKGHVGLCENRVYPQW